MDGNHETLKIPGAEWHKHQPPDYDPALEFCGDQIGKRPMKPTWQYDVNIRRRKRRDRRGGRWRAEIGHAAF